MSDHRAQDVLDFWFHPKSHRAYLTTRAEWFRKDESFDNDIRTRFGELIEDALSGRLASWADATESSLALILATDQFTRNAFRGSPRAFAGDPMALNLARALVASGADKKLAGVQRQFIYLPYEHAEDLATQDECIRLFKELGESQTALAGLVEWAERHRVIIARFGRFPHRNAILRRVSTPEEEAFLNEPGSSF